MSTSTSKYDPWGPISSTLFETCDSDLVQNVIGLTGVTVPWPHLSEFRSEGERIRAFRPVITTAYQALQDEEERGRFSQIVAKEIYRRWISDQRKWGRIELLMERLKDIGYTITEDGLLITQDALVSEQFFPPNSRYDAYVAIRDILQTARSNILVVDPYLGTSLLPILRAIEPSSLEVWLLTVAKNLKPDFCQELTAFREQFPSARVLVRSSGDFHDRFVSIDGEKFYHIGASIKDAGTRAFVISQLQDRQVVDLVKQYVKQAWEAAEHLS